MKVSYPQLKSSKRLGGFLLWASAALMALCAALVVLARMPFFWQLSRVERAGSALVLALLLAPLMVRAMITAWRNIFTGNSRKWVVLLLALVGIGTAVGVLFDWPVRFANTLHRIELSFDAPAGKGLRVIELRDGDGNLVPADAVRLAGDWKVEGNSFYAPGGQSAALSYQFRGPDQGSARVRLEAGPTAADVQVRIDRVRKTERLAADRIGDRFVEAPLLGSSKTGSVLRLLWIITLGLILPICLTALAVALPMTVEMVQGEGAVRHTIFIAAVLLLLIMPLRGMGSPGSLDRKFWGRENLLRMASDFRFKVLQDKVFTSYVIGSGSWLMFTGDLSLDDYQNAIPLTSDQLETIRAKLDILDHRLSQHGIAFLVVVPPNKNTIYPEKMPAFIPRLGEESRLDQVMAYQQEHGAARILDLRSVLLEGKQQRDLYYMTDTHWNSFGAYIGYREILNALSGEVPSLRPHSLDEYQVVSAGMHGGDIAAVLGQISVEEEYFALKPLYKRLPLKQWIGADSLSRHMITTALPDPALPRLVMYRDSFAVGLIPLLSDHFSRAVYILGHDQVDETFIYSEMPDVVVIEITERNVQGLADIPVKP